MHKTEQEDLHSQVTKFTVLVTKFTVMVAKFTIFIYCGNKVHCWQSSLYYGNIELQIILTLKRKQFETVL